MEEKCIIKVHANARGVLPVLQMMSLYDLCIATSEANRQALLYGFGVAHHKALPDLSWGEFW